MTNITKSEGLSAALAFIKAPPQDKDERVYVSRQIIDNLINQIGTIKEAAGFSQFVLGGLIDMWKREDFWKLVPQYKEWWQFGDFCKTELRMSLPKANNLVRIWNKSQKLGVDPESIDRVGWVKAMYAMKVAGTKEEAEELMQEAESMTQEQFIEKVKARSSGGKFDVSRNCRKLFLLTSDERDFVDETIEYAATNIMKKSLGPEVPPSEVLVFIMKDWREGRDI